MISAVIGNTVNRDMAIYKRGKNIYNYIPVEPVGIVMRKRKEQGEKILGQNLRYIKGLIRKKIVLYDPLDFRATYRGFIKWIQNHHLKEIEHMENREVEDYLNGLTRDFLIENAYYALSGNYIRRIIMNKLGNPNPNDIRVHDVVDFVREKLEKEGLRKLKTFQEKSKFKTFLVTAVNRLYIDSWRKKGTEEDKETKYEEDIENFLHPPAVDPFTRLITQEDEEFKNTAVALLPGVLDKLNSREKVAIKMKYEKNMKLSAIARTLGSTRYRTDQLIKQIEQEMKKEILAEIKKGGKNETPGR